VIYESKGDTFGVTLRPGGSQGCVIKQNMFIEVMKSNLLFDFSTIPYLAGIQAARYPPTPRRGVGVGVDMIQTSLILYLIPRSILTF